ncbi:MAG TPA: hypothetical protein VFP47_12140, partial [Pyrinomonadaceae bacterium]|nr:hypothetical protein [Pyrinomonadaceae bacterium]
SEKSFSLHGICLALNDAETRKERGATAKLFGESQSLLMQRLQFERKRISYGSQRARRKGRIARPVGTGHHWRSSGVLTLPKFVA